MLKKLDHISPSGLAGKFGCTRQNIYLMVRRGELPIPRKFGRLTRFVVSEVEAKLEQAPRAGIGQEGV